MSHDHLVQWVENSAYLQAWFQRWSRENGNRGVEGFVRSHRYVIENHILFNRRRI